MTDATCAALAVGVVIALVGARAGARWRPRRLPVTPGTSRGRPARARRPVRLALASTSLAVIALALGVMVAVMATGAAGVAIMRHRHLHGARRRRAIAAALPDSIEFLVLMVHAGLSPTQAVVEAAERAPAATRAGFAATTHRLQRGHGLADALTALVDEIGPAAAPIADGIAAADRYGLPLAPLLDNLADQAHAARRRLAEAEARTLPVRLSFPLVACTLPSFALLAIVPAVMGTVSSLQGHAP
ncbi:MAG: type II secretion system F family protein [Ilumatobacteraceae bacterium]